MKLCDLQDGQALREQIKKLLALAEPETKLPPTKQILIPHPPTRRD